MEESRSEEERLTYERLGRRLRDARLEKKLELGHASKELHIRSQYLSALEEGNLHELPGTAFVQGYLHRYAWFLGLEADSFVRQYEEIGGLPQRRFFHIPQSIRRDHQPSKQLVIISTLVAIMVSWFWVHTNPSVLQYRIDRPTEPVKLDRIMPLAGASDCMHQSQMVWPPCYYDAVFFEAESPEEKLRSYMELYE